METFIFRKTRLPVDDTEQLKNRICVQSISTANATVFNINSSVTGKRPFIIICTNGVSQLFIVNMNGDLTKVYADGSYVNVTATIIDNLQIKMSGSALSWNNIIVF